MLMILVEAHIDRCCSIQAGVRSQVSCFLLVSNNASRTNAAGDGEDIAIGIVQVWV